MTEASTKPGPTRSNQSAEKLLLLLETMSTLDEPARLQDLAAALGMNASTVLRFLAPLRARGYVAQDGEGGRYHLTFKLCGLADNVSSRVDLRRLARPVLRELADGFGESANLSVESDMSVAYIEVCNHAGKTLLATQRIGHQAPMHSTGVGKIFLSACSEERLERILAAKGLPRLTERTITTRAALARELERIRRLGYSLDNEECETGARCVAAPVRNYAGDIVAGVSVSGPVTRMTDARIQGNLPHLLAAAERLSRQLGWEG